MKTTKAVCTITKQHNGSLLVSTICNGEYRKMVYYGYSKKHALKQFIQSLPS